MHKSHCRSVKLRSQKSHTKHCSHVFYISQLRHFLFPNPLSSSSHDKTIKQSSAPRAVSSPTHNPPPIPDSFRVPCFVNKCALKSELFCGLARRLNQFLMFPLKQVYSYFNSFIIYWTVWCQFQLAQQTSSVSNRGSETSSGGSGKALSKPSLPTNQQVVTRPCLCQKKKTQRNYVN